MDHEPVPGFREILAGYIEEIEEGETPVDGVIAFLREVAMHMSAAAIMAPDAEVQSKATRFAEAFGLVADTIEE